MSEPRVTYGEWHVDFCEDWELQNVLNQLEKKQQRIAQVIFTGRNIDNSSLFVVISESRHYVEE